MPVAGRVRSPRPLGMRGVVVACPPRTYGARPIRCACRASRAEPGGWRSVGHTVCSRGAPSCRDSDVIELARFGVRPIGQQQVIEDRIMSLEFDGSWFCRNCRSLNRREANRCYSCRMGKNSAGKRTPDRPAGDPGVPVMDESIARSPHRPPTGRRVQVTAPSHVRSSGRAAGSTVAVATSTIAPAAHEVAVLAPPHVIVAGRPSTSVPGSVCPFLGLREDPSTRYDFPESANRCHAASRRSAGSPALLPRIVAAISGTRRPQPIGMEHQTTCCLTAAHETCARYRAVKRAAGDR